MQDSSSIVHVQRCGQGMGKPQRMVQHPKVNKGRE